jgi:XTP/dITP diphosphohydrolase
VPTSSAGRIVLVETSDLLPDLLPFQAWDALARADVILARDPQTHPSAAALHLAGLDLEALEPSALGRDDLLLTRPGGPDERRLAKTLVERASTDGVAVYLLGSEERGLAPALAGMVAEHDLEIELVFLAQLPRGTELLRAVGVMDRLRDPDGGCPWDLEQDHASLGRYLVEETYELLEAIESGDDDDIREELGDVLLQVLFHARIAAERRAFGVDDVATALVDKLVRRHPHVFDVEAAGAAIDAADVQRRWDRLKADEKGGDRGPLDGIPAGMPGLALLDALLRRVRRLGMLPEEPSTIVADLRATLDAIAAHALTALDPSPRGPAASGEPDAAGPGLDVELVGTLLVQVTALARSLDLEADATARSAGARLRAAVTEVLASAEASGVEVAAMGERERLAAWPRSAVDEAR